MSHAVTLRAAAAAVVAARHLALLLFGCTVAAAAWPPAGRYSYSAGDRNLMVWFGGRCVVAEATAGSSAAGGSVAGGSAAGGSASAGLPAPPAVPGAPPAVPPAGPPAVASFLPAGLVLEHPAGRSGPVRLTVPMAATVALMGLAWLGVLLLGGGGLAPAAGACGRDRGGSFALVGRAAAGAARRLVPAGGWLWSLRCASGAAALVGAWWCAYAMPRDGGAWLYNEAQALHVAGAAFGVALATMLITFD